MGKEFSKNLISHISDLRKKRRWIPVSSFAKATENRSAGMTDVSAGLTELRLRIISPAA
jgi:hypothetical protein